jgi:hypothetical protein
MKQQSMRISIMIVSSMLASSSFAQAQTAEEACSNRSLRGDYGFSIEGTLLAGPVTGPLRGVAMTHFDGQGKLSQVDHVVVNGAPPAIDWSPATGT